MKTILYTLLTAALILTTACRSIDKLVDQGRYDEAIVLATKKLAGKKKKKTKHIKALEKAFYKVNQRDLNYIATLKSKDDGHSWERIYDYALQIERRQQKVRPFLPLISKENYMAHFELLDMVPILDESRDKTTKYFYQEGSTLLNEARITGNKIVAQEAHYKFSKIGKFFDAYKDVSALMGESNTLGLLHILVKWDESYKLNTMNRNLPVREIVNMDSRWVRHHIDHEEGIAFDAVSTLYIEDIDISPENEIVNRFVETKDLEEWIDRKDDQGNTLLDSSGQAIQYLLVERVRADITEIFRTKDARVIGRMETLDYTTGALIDSDRYTHEINFDSDACTLIGDRRALTDGIRKRIDNTLLQFPNDYEMIEDGLALIQKKFFRHINRLELNNYYRTHIALR